MSEVGWLCGAMYVGQAWSSANFVLDSHSSISVINILLDHFFGLLASLRRLLKFPDGKYHLSVEAN